MGSYDSTISIYDFSDNNFNCINLLEGHESEVKDVAWSQDLNRIASCGRDKTIWVWDYNEAYEFYCTAIINAHY